MVMARGSGVRVRAGGGVGAAELSHAAGGVVGHVLPGAHGRGRLRARPRGPVRPGDWRRGLGARGGPVRRAWVAAVASTRGARRTVTIDSGARLVSVWDFPPRLGGARVRWESLVAAPWCAA